MPDTATPQDQPISVDVASLLRDMEDKQRLLRDRVLLLGNTVVDDRDKTFKELQEAKGTLVKLKEDVQRLKDLAQRMAEQISGMARKEELMIIQRQLDLLRER